MTFHAPMNCRSFSKTGLEEGEGNAEKEEIPEMPDLSDDLEEKQPDNSVDESAQDVVL